MRTIINLIFLGSIISVPLNYLEEADNSLADRYAMATNIYPNRTQVTTYSLDTPSTSNTNLPASSSFPEATYTSITNLPVVSSLPDTTTTSSPGLPSSNTLHDTTSTTATSYPDPVTTPVPPDSGSAPSTVTTYGTRNDTGTIRKRSSITLYYLLRKDRQADHSESGNLNSEVAIESDESLNNESVSTGDNPEGYDLQITDTMYTWIKEATRIYSPDSWHLLMQYDNLPQVSEARHTGNLILSMPKLAGTFEYLEGDSKTGMISSMSANVHEISHGYYSKNVIRHAKENNVLLNSDNVAGFIFLSPNESYYIEFPKKDLFPSKELAARIPRKLRTSRFNTYINGKTLTQSQGVFGLLDELNAFYLGSKFNFEILEGYKTAEGSAIEGFYHWIIDSRSSMTALFEFDFFILEYLLYMKSHYPQNYASLKSYQPFQDAYAAVRIKFSDLLLKYLDKIHKEIQIQNTSGTTIFTVEGNTLWMKEAGGTRHTGTSIILNDMLTLLPILKSNRYSEIEKDFTVLFPERNIYSNF